MSLGSFFQSNTEELLNTKRCRWYRMESALSLSLKKHQFNRSRKKQKLQKSVEGETCHNRGGDKATA